MLVTTSEIIWLRALLVDLDVHFSTLTPLHCDNQSSIKIAKNLVFHGHTKYIEVDCYFVLQHYLAHNIT